VEPDTGADQMLAQITEARITQIETNAPADPADVRARKSRRHL